MCVAYPLRVVEINGNMAVGEAEGVRFTFAIDFCPCVRAGDYVLVHAGYAMEILDEKAAEDNLALFKELNEVLND